jgi:hypothetical protein
MSTLKGYRLAVGFSLMLSLFPGCDGASEENRSTRSAADPDRFQKAQAEAQETAARARAAEARTTKGRLKVEEP